MYLSLRNIIHFFSNVEGKKSLRTPLQYTFACDAICVSWCVCVFVFVHTGCSGKIVFFQNSLQLLPCLHRCKRNSYWLEIFGTTNKSRELARESWQTFENSWKKHNILWTPCRCYEQTALVYVRIMCTRMFVWVPRIKNYTWCLYYFKMCLFAIDIESMLCMCVCVS